WVRLHTNAPHHRRAALNALGCQTRHEITREAVAQTVRGWEKDRLEQAIVDANGCAAAMHTLEEWARHPQGMALAQEPLIAWQNTERDTEQDIERGAGHRQTEHRTTQAQSRPVAGALHGLKVLDLTRVLAGPVATRFLAGFGADVLRIDPPDWNEPALEPDMTLGKRCAGLDLHQAEDRRTFERLLRATDMLVHGYRPGALERLGYGAAARHALNPGLIEVALCAYGWSGPLAGTWSASWSGRRG